MLTHKDVWRGIDQLAARNGFSASGLARRAGLDPTTSAAAAKSRQVRIGPPWA